MTGRGGRTSSKIGMSAAVSIVVATTACRRAAERRRRSAVAASPRASTAVASTKLARTRAVIAHHPFGAHRPSGGRLPFWLSRPGRRSVDLFVGQLRGFAAEERGDGLLGRAVEEGLDDVAEGRFRRCPAGRHRRVDEPLPVVVVAHVALLLEHAELGADGGVAGVAGEIRHDLGRGGAAAAEEDVHDLALAAGEDAVESAHDVIFLARLCEKNNTTTKPLSRASSPGPPAHRVDCAELWLATSPGPTRCPDSAPTSRR